MGLPRLPIAKPCAADWETMPGDARVRHCPSCDKDVYNTRALTRAELAGLIARGGHLPCMRIQRRPDGSVVTRDDLAPLRRALAWLRLKATVAAGLLLGLLSPIGGGLAAAGERAAAPPKPAASAASTPKRRADKGRQKKPKKPPAPPPPAPGKKPHRDIDMGLPLLSE